jgi:hypothetical protein
MTDVRCQFGVGVSMKQKREEAGRVYFAHIRDLLMEFRRIS